MTNTTQTEMGNGPYRIVGEDAGGKLGVTTFATRADLIAHVVDVMGGQLRGLSGGRQLRAELQNQPSFSNLCGPMWDGDAVRYETVKAYAELSL